MNFLSPPCHFFSSVLFCCLIFNYCKGQDSDAQLKLNKIGTSASDTLLQHWIGKKADPNRNAVYAEFFGSSANVYSVNYERCLTLEKLKYDNWLRGSLSVGINYFSEKYAAPILFHFSTGSDYCFEAGCGWVPWFSTKRREDGLAVFSGLRYQPERKGMLAKFAITPTYMVQEKKHWRMLFGFSFGWAF